jgi:hypothetical protein
VLLESAFGSGYGVERRRMREYTVQVFNWVIIDCQGSFLSQFTERLRLEALAYQHLEKTTPLMRRSCCLLCIRGGEAKSRSLLEYIDVDTVAIQELCNAGSSDIEVLVYVSLGFHNFHKWHKFMKPSAPLI